MSISKKKAAALAAVSALLMEEPESRVSPSLPAVSVSLWSLSGRQDIMSLRALVTARRYR